MSCDLALVVTVLQASEGALRQAGLHRSAGEFEQLLRRFLRQRHEASREPIGQPLQLPQRSRRGLPQPRRIPGLHQGVGAEGNKGGLHSTQVD